MSHKTKMEKIKDEIFGRYKLLEIIPDEFIKKEYNSCRCEPFDDDDNFIFLNAQMGTGKTYQMLDFIKKHKHESWCLFSTRISYTDEILILLKKYGFKAYYDKQIKKHTDSKIIEERLVLQFESLFKMGKCKFDNIVIDEATSFFFQCYAKTNKNKLTINQKKLFTMFNNAKRVFLLDAYVLEPIFNFYNELCGNKLRLVRNNYMNPRGRFKFHKFAQFDSTYEYVKQITSELLEGGKIVVPTGSKKFGKEIVKTINVCIDSPLTLDTDKEIFVNTKVQLYEESNRFPHDVRANDEFQKYDLVIYTPTITAGVDFSVEDYFDTMFVYSTNSTIDALSLVQMIGRVRYVKLPRRRSDPTHYIAIRDDPKVVLYEEDFDVESIKTAYYTRKLYTKELFQPSIETECDSYGYFNEHFNTETDIFTKYYFHKLLIENMSKLLYSEIVTHILKSKGFQDQGSFIPNNSIPINSDKDIVSALLKQDEIELYESADVCPDDTLNIFKRQLEASVYKTIPKSEYDYKKYSIKKSHWVNTSISTTFDLENNIIESFGTNLSCADMVMFDENKQIINNLLFAKNPDLVTTQQTEIDNNRYDHTKCSNSIHKTFYINLMEILGLESVFDKKKITAPDFLDKKDKIIGFFKEYSAITRKNYNFNEESKRMVTTIITQLNKYLYSFGYCMFQNQGREQINGKRVHVYSLEFEIKDKDLDRISKKDLDKMLVYVNNYFDVKQLNSAKINVEQGDDTDNDVEPEKKHDFNKPRFNNRGEKLATLDELKARINKLF